MIDLRQDGRILYISSVDISLGRGPSVNEREFVLELCKAFGERAHVLVPETKTQLTEISRHNFTFSKSHRQYHPIGFFQHQLSQIRLAKALIESGRFNFLVLRLSALPFAESYITRRYRMPYAIKTQGLGTIDGLRHQGLIGKALAPLNDKMVQDITSRAIAIDVCTTAYLTYLPERLSLDPGKLRWIDNATNTERFHPFDKMAARCECNLDAFDPIIGFVGGKPWERGGAQMIELAPRLLSLYPNLGVVIVGGGSGLDQLRKQARKLGVAECCVFPGWVPYERVPYFINAFDVCISLDTAEHLSIVGNSSQKVRQYLACGKPVVSGPGGNSFLEKEGLGSIVSPDDVDQIAEAVMVWLSLNGDEKKAFSDKAARFARKNLSVTKALEDRIEFWNEGLRANSGGPGVGKP